MTISGFLGKMFTASSGSITTTTTAQQSLQQSLASGFTAYQQILGSQQASTSSSQASTYAFNGYPGAVNPTTHQGVNTQGSNTTQFPTYSFDFLIRMREDIEAMKETILAMKQKIVKLEGELIRQASTGEGKDKSASEILSQMDCYIA